MNCILFFFFLLLCHANGILEQNRDAAERLALMQGPLQARGYSTGQMAATFFQSVLIIFYVGQRYQIA